VPEIDPYAVLVVPRTATRQEIASAYRRLAKQHHPDAGAPPSSAMARINEAWRVLSDPARRARWDREHAVVVPPHWAARPEAPVRRAPTQRPVPDSALDSGWLAVGVVAVLAVAVIGVMGLIGLASAGSVDEVGTRFSSSELSFRYPDDWRVYPGEDDAVEHRVVAHAATFGFDAGMRCTSFGDPCQLNGDAIPPGEASIIVTAWGDGTPPVPDPVRARPFGLDAQRFFGGSPAAFGLERGVDAAIAWWQLSPPGFPERWIEVRADIGGRRLEQDAVLAQIEQVLATIEFGP
jgi:hypothetical protein